MKKLFLIALLACLFAPMGLAQNNEAIMTNPVAGKVAPNPIEHRGLGDPLWAMDTETPTGDLQCLGAEFDGTNYWVTGAYNSAIYEITPGGVLVNQFSQPAGNIGYWGWRDLAYDGQYLYAGDDSSAPGYITKIDPADGSVVELYGPFPVVPCRALAYEAGEDCFYTASWNSTIYKCFRDNTSTGYANPLAGMYGAAEVTGDIWWWSQDSSGLLGSEMLTDGTFTGSSFEGDFTLLGGGIAGGAGAYDAGGGLWELVGMAQGSPDHIVAYDMATVTLPLEITPDEVSAYFGGTFDLFLNGGPADRDYIILGSATGTAPGFNLPGGLHMDLNWDWFTDLLLNMTLAGGYGLVVDFLGTLDGNGMATASLTFPGHCELYDDVELCFAWCTYNPFDFVSNTVCVNLTGAPPPIDEYSYDDGTIDNLLGYYSGGEMCWINYYVRDASIPTITEIGTIWGSGYYTGYGPGNGVAAVAYIWADDGDAQLTDSDTLVRTQAVTTASYDQDTVVWYTLDTSWVINTSGFFVGFCLNSTAGQYIYPMDEGNVPTNGNSWWVGAVAGIVDPVNLSSNSNLSNMQSYGYDCYAPARAR